jgi:hypothetical protein
VERLQEGRLQQLLQSLQLVPRRLLLQPLLLPLRHLLVPRLHLYLGKQHRLSSLGAMQRRLRHAVRAVGRQLAKAVHQGPHQSC